MTGKFLNARMDALEKEARAMFRLIGPRVSAMEDENVALKLCTICTPPPKVYECFICTFACEMQWQYDLHVRINPENCQRYAQKWAKQYAQSEQ